jgi:hypothetical protein
MNNAIVRMMAVAPAARKRDWLESALQAAIELELSTLPPYLCAMWSINGAGPGGPGKPVYDLIDGVVKQEMLHMGIVCNLLNGIGGTPKIVEGYTKHIKYPGPLPGGVRPGGVRQELIVSLSGLTKPYLHDVMMEIEFPENRIPIVEAEALLESETFPTIGAFYDAIRDAFATLAPAVNTDKQLTSSIGLTKIPASGVAAAIDLIKSQGEGSATDPFEGGELAHYYRFAEIYVGKGLIALPGGGFGFHGPAIPFPDTITMGKVPAGGYRQAAPAVAALLKDFNAKFSAMLDNLDKAWQTVSQAALGAAIGKMLQLKAAAAPIMAKSLPIAEDGFYGPDFQYIAPAPPAAPQAPGAGAREVTTNPKFADITALLANLANSDPNIDNAPHGAFWTMSYDAFLAQKTDDWGAEGRLVVPGDPTNSMLYRALAGIAPFGASIAQMPDVDADPKGRLATPAELQMVSTWITNNCPQ